MDEADAGLTQVAFVKTGDRTEGVRSALALLAQDVFSNSNVLLKPNYNSGHPTPGSTHNDVLRALIEGLSERGARAITVADRSGMGATRQVMEHKGVLAMAGELGFETLVFEEMEELSGKKPAAVLEVTKEEVKKKKHGPKIDQFLKLIEARS